MFRTHPQKEVTVLAPRPLPGGRGRPARPGAYVRLDGAQPGTTRMARLLNRRRYVGKHRAEETAAPRRARHGARATAGSDRRAVTRSDRRAATRSDRRAAARHADPAPRRLSRLARDERRAARTPHSAATHPRWRRRAPYAAAGLLALSGAVSADLGRASRPATRAPLAAPAAAPAAQRIRPAAVRPAALRVVPSATPRASRATRSRTVLVYGATYRGRATWYGPGFAGRRTASGEVFRPYSELTAAHRWLPFGTRLRVCRSGRCVVVRVNDRGPFGDAMLDLSHLAAERLGMVRAGIAPVTATVVTERVVRSAA